MFEDAEKRVNNMKGISYWKDGRSSACKKCKKQRYSEKHPREMKEVREGMKKCSKCGEWKLLEEYHKNKSSKDGRRPNCRECQKEYNKQHYEANKEHKKEYYEVNKEHKKEQFKQYYGTNKEHRKEQFKQYYEANKEHRKEYGKQWYENIKENNLQTISNIVESIRPIFKELNLPVYGYIYKFENIKTGHVYIGQTIQPLDRRYGSNVIKSWIKDRKHYQNQKFLDELIEEDIKLIEMLDVACCEYHLDKLEAYYINKYDSCNNGYNNQPGNHITNDGIEEFNKILEENGLKFIDGKLIEK